MTWKQKLASGQRELADQPFIYEIRVRGRLDNEYWAEWFEGMTITVEETGETVLYGPLPDQAALYGLLSRLRDLAIPLLSVNVLKANSRAGVRLRNQRRKIRINWVLLLIYLVLAGALSSMTVFLTSEGLIHTALALTILFTLLGGIAYGFFIGDGGKGWLVLAMTVWLSSVITLTLYLTIMGWLPTPLAIATLLFLLACGLIYFLYWWRRREARKANAPAQWEKLGYMSGPSRSEPMRLERGDRK
jgi:hypothetical protein